MELDIRANTSEGERCRLEIHYSGKGKWYAHIAFEISEKAVGINNLMALYIENGFTKLVNGDL